MQPSSPEAASISLALKRLSRVQLIWGVVTHVRASGVYGSAANRRAALAGANVSNIFVARYSIAQSVEGYWTSSHWTGLLMDFDPLKCKDCPNCWLWSQGLGNTSAVCLGWCMTTCTGWLFLSECSTSLLWQSIVVLRTELHRTSPTTVCQSPKFLVASVCDLPDVINCQFREFATTLLGLVHFLTTDQQSGIHCLIIARSSCRLLTI